MLIKICQRCGRQIRQDEECDCSKEERRESHAVYNTAQWKKIAKAARQRAHYLDEYEMQYGPLTMDGLNIGDNNWNWDNSPWPWEVMK